jgi:Nucleotide modification associated domain 2
MSGQVVYAMKVTQKMTMEEYDEHTKLKLRKKIPDWSNQDLLRRVGDSIYDFSVIQPVLRKSVHLEGNRDTDLGGKYAVTSQIIWSWTA